MQIGPAGLKSVHMRVYIQAFLIGWVTTLLLTGPFMIRLKFTVLEYILLTGAVVGGSIFQGTAWPPVFPLQCWWVYLSAFLFTICGLVIYTAVWLYIDYHSCCTVWHLSWLQLLAITEATAGSCIWLAIYWRCRRWGA